MELNRNSAPVENMMDKIAQKRWLKKKLYKDLLQKAAKFEIV